MAPRETTVTRVDASVNGATTVEFGRHRGSGKAIPRRFAPSFSTASTARSSSSDASASLVPSTSTMGRALSPGAISRESARYPRSLRDSLAEGALAPTPPPFSRAAAARSYLFRGLLAPLEGSRVRGALGSMGASAESNAREPAPRPSARMRSLFAAMRRARSASYSFISCSGVAMVGGRPFL